MDEAEQLVEAADLWWPETDDERDRLRDLLRRAREALRMLGEVKSGE